MKRSFKTKTAFLSVKFLLLILLPNAIKMETLDCCRPADSTSMSLLFRALHKGTLIIFSIPFCYLVVAYATIFFWLSSLLSVFKPQQWLNDFNMFNNWNAKLCRLYHYTRARSKTWKYEHDIAKLTFNPDVIKNKSTVVENNDSACMPIWHLYNSDNFVTLLWH